MNEEIDRAIAKSPYAKRLKDELVTVDPELMQTHLWIRLHRDAHATNGAMAEALRKAREKGGILLDDLIAKEGAWTMAGYPPPWETETCGCECIDGFYDVDICKLAPEAEEVKKLQKKMDTLVEKAKELCEEHEKGN